MKIGKIFSIFGICLATDVNPTAHYTIHENQLNSEKLFCLNLYPAKKQRFGITHCENVKSATKCCTNSFHVIECSVRCSHFLILL